MHDAMQESLVTRVLSWLEEVYTGADTVEPSSRFTSLAHLPGAAEVTQEDFAYYASLVQIVSFPTCNRDCCQRRRCIAWGTKSTVLSASRGVWYAGAAAVN